MCWWKYYYHNNIITYDYNGNVATTICGIPFLCMSYTVNDYMDVIIVSILIIVAPFWTIGPKEREIRHINTYSTNSCFLYPLTQPQHSFIQSSSNQQLSTYIMNTTLCVCRAHVKEFLYAKPFICLMTLHHAERLPNRRDEQEGIVDEIRKNITISQVCRCVVRLFFSTGVKFRKFYSL